MNSKIIVFLPIQTKQSNLYANIWKRISELGFENVLVDSSYLIEKFDPATTIQKEQLKIWGCKENTTFTHDQLATFLQNMHSLDAGYYLLQEGEHPKKTHSEIEMIQESGIKILSHEDGFYVDETEEHHPYVLLNPLSFQEKPLQSHKIIEKTEEIALLNSFRSSSLYYLVQPDVNLPTAEYWKHCKDILNRLYFFDIR